MKRSILILPLLLLRWADITSVQTEPDPSLLRDIAAIKAIDVHSHSLSAGEGLRDEESFEPFAVWAALFLDPPA